MNQRDRNNLEFLLTSSPETLKDWYHQMDAEDHQYARQLMDMYAIELQFRSVSAQVEHVLCNMNSYPEAQHVIDRIRRSAV